MDRKRKYLVIFVMLLFGVLRIVFSFGAGVWFPAEQYWDDALLVRYSEIVAHYKYVVPFSLAKDIGYSVFLCAIGTMHIPYELAIAAIWIAFALLTYFVCRKLKMNRAISLFFFVYNLFLPEAFESWCGTRLYRNSIIAPFVGISLMLCILLFFEINAEKVIAWRAILLALTTGLFSAFTYYIKEDGIWLLACIIFSTIVCIGKVLVNRKEYIKRSLISAIPVVTVILVCLLYRFANYMAFGVFADNARTQGEAAKFVSNVYKIESSERNCGLWAPPDAIEKAFDNSETLKANPALREAYFKSAWANGDLVWEPVYGDFVGWIVYTEGNNLGIWNDFAEKEAFFKKVNSELEEAFKNGSLKKDKGRIFLLPSAGSRNLSEVFELFGAVKDAFSGALWNTGYEFGVDKQENVYSEEEYNLAVFASNTTGIEYLANPSSKYDSLCEFSKYTGGVSFFYKVFNSILLLCTGAGFVWSIVQMVRSKSMKGLFGLFIMIATLGISFMYAFSISWFSSFISDGMKWMNYYTVALPVLLSISFIWGVNLLTRKNH